MSMHQSPDMGESLARRFESIVDCVNSSASLVHRGRALTASLIVTIGATRFLVRIDGGRIVELTRQFPLFRESDLCIQGTEQAWHCLWKKVPGPGWHDILALHKRGEMRIEGNTRIFFAHLQYIKDLLEMPRHAGASA